jgi:hypothetical protein
LTVASERQIAANRRNAQTSTGPRSGAGRKRASGNSLRHGLTSARATNARLDRGIEKLARQIAGRNADAVTLDYARDAARAEFDLTQIRRIKVALIERAAVLGEGPSAGVMVLSEPDRTAEIVHRVLPDLRVLDRYERRAFARRDRALKNVIGRSKSGKQL